MPEVTTLFIHPRDSRLPELWPGRHDTSAVGGTHLSMIEEHAPETAPKHPSAARLCDQEE
ncbi:hypothetical protein B0293_28765 [Amycolatopsis azurea DSM 43854]|uniref:Malonyl CoA-acyl carrier protein transacylase n=1 Tax=Amycolatopsis azurea DSM 43854 TaxID=1238180 RepID=M2PVT0_9PSEU|nr:Malonyl CoA-acyl carrier protein transacylase [Amycolatopsis azurea DSM 43854]OOC02971.1 hypothetical protein B0293_28765 [Amycolatopsis azurea DSM 43854]